MSQDETSLTVRMTVPEIVAEYEAAVAEMREACSLLARAEARINAALTNNSQQWREVRLIEHHRSFDADRPDDAFERLRRNVWRQIVERTEVRRMLSTARTKELDTMLNDGDLPEVTLTAVQSLVGQFLTQLPELLTEAIQEVFNLLRPPGSKLKTNTELEIGERAIVPCLEVGDLWIRHSVNEHRSAGLRTLENVFTALDGKGQISREYYSRLETEIGKLSRDGDSRGETEYFEFRCCRNGNLHLRFKRLDLLKRLNEVAGGKTLRPAEVA